MQLLRSGARSSFRRLRSEQPHCSHAPSMLRPMSAGASAAAAAAPAAAAPADAAAASEHVPGMVTVRPEQYDAQLEAKVARVSGLFAAFDVPEVEVHRSAPSHYRQRAEFR
jgi:tRNA/tmRNA/rRNA uracil-C5-methylase (TrmA/RlmC/RlmD family)